MHRIVPALPARPQPIAIRYGASAIMVVLCFLLMLGLYQGTGTLALFVLYPAIFASAVVFDRGSGVFATGLAAVLCYLLLKPPGSILLTGEFLILLALFILIALGLAVVSESLRRGWETAATAEQAKSLLLDELTHRTKNDLAKVISLLSVQARSHSSEGARAALTDAVARIRAIAAAHEHLGASQQSPLVDMKSYLQGLCEHLSDNLRGIRDISILVEVPHVEFRSETATQIGLIVNELVTNALKHAFPNDKTGFIRIVLQTAPSFTLLVEDNGVGCPPNPASGTGTRLTRMLAEQLGGSILWEPGGPGCRVRLELNRDLVDPRAAGLRV